MSIRERGLGNSASNRKLENMTALNTDRATPLGSATLFRIVMLAEQAMDVVAAWHGARHTRRELSRLSDAQLDDIGLDRGDIARIAGAR